MHEWLLLTDLGADLGALAPAVHFAAGALAVMLRRAVVVAARDLLAWWRASRTLAFPPDDPTRIWAEFKELRGACVASATNLETVVARFKEAATARIAERAGSVDRLQQMQRALAE